MNYYLSVLKKYAVFSGRARRAEYWYFALFNIIIVIGLSLFEWFSGIASETDGSVLANILPVSHIDSVYSSRCSQDARCKQKWLVYLNSNL